MTHAVLVILLTCMSLPNEQARVCLNKHPEALQAADQLLEKYGEVK
mgnify:CR=1 FL=1